MKLVDIEDEPEEIENKIVKSDPIDIPTPTEMPFTIQDRDMADVIDTSRNYREEMLERYLNVEEIDRTGIDDWVHEKDKVCLVKFISDMVKKEHPYFPSSMESLLVRKMYYDTIEKMNKDDYLAEKEEEAKLSSVDKVLKLISEEDNLEYAIRD